MDKTIEKNFFRMFSKGGAATLGLEYLEFKVNDDGYDAEEYDRRYRKYCTEEIPIKIKELTEAFDDSIFGFYDGEHPAIMTEIENNLDNCSNEYEKESYLHSLLTPLKHWANAFNNTPFINTVNRLINETKQDLLETCHDPEMLEKRIKEADETHKKIIDGSEKRRRELSQSFSPWSEDGTPESYCAYWEGLVRDYAYMLDAILLERRIDLFKLQKDCGVWLIEERDAMLLYPYLGTVERGEYLIKALQKEIKQDEKQEPQQEANPQPIPTIKGTDKERFVFYNALQKQYMTLNGGGYKWHKSMRLLAYMCGRLYCGDIIIEDSNDYSTKLIKGKHQLPEREVNELFGKKVSASRNMLKDPPKDYYIIDDFFKNKRVSK